MKEIKTGHRGHAVLIDVDGEVGELEDVVARKARPDDVELVLNHTVAPHHILEQLVTKGQD